MKIQNISDVNKFFAVIDQCKGTVELVSPEGDRINLKSKLTQYLSMATIFSNGYIKELELVAYDKDDIDRLIKFMYRENKSCNSSASASVTRIQPSRSRLETVKTVSHPPRDGCLYILPDYRRFSLRFTSSLTSA